MTQVVAEEQLGGIPMSPALQATLLRAREYASGQSHREVTLEHLLLALTEDEDATAVMQSCRLDLGRLRNDVAGWLGDLGDRASGPGAAPAISSALTQILKYATLAAKQGRRPKIDGAIVLAAIVGDGKSMAAGFLKAQGLTFEEAVRVLQQSIRDGGRAAQPTAIAVPSGGGAPRGRNADDILAAARSRVMSRSPMAGVDAQTAPPPAERDAETAAGGWTEPPTLSPHLEMAPASPTLLSGPPALPSRPEAPAGPPPVSSWAPPPLPTSVAPATGPRPPLPPLVPLGAPPRPPAQGPPGPGPAAAPPPWSAPIEPRPAPMLPQSAPRTGPPRTQAPVPFGYAEPAPLAPSPFARPESGPAQPAGLSLPARPAIEASQLAHNIPATLTLGETRTIEVHVTRTPLNAERTASRPAPDRRDVVTARAISVRLRPAKGRFVIDQPSPETQWDKAVDGARLGGEAAVWRFTVQPMALGRGDLVLSVTARTIAADGMILETPLPDQVFDVRTKRGWRRTASYVGSVALIVGASLSVIEFAGEIFNFQLFKWLKAMVWK